MAAPATKEKEVNRNRNEECMGVKRGRETTEARRRAGKQSRFPAATVNQFIACGYRFLFQPL
jgi:hypothetical protein